MSPQVKIESPTNLDMGMSLNPFDNQFGMANGFGMGMDGLSFDQSLGAFGGQNYGMNLGFGTGLNMNLGKLSYIHNLNFMFQNFLFRFRSIKSNQLGRLRQWKSFFNPKLVQTR